ncbi:MAG: SagB family peptide dehydrogenase [Deltaproteobacteria bacterium]
MPWLLSLRERTSLHQNSDGRLVFESPFVRLVVDEGICSPLAVLADEPAGEEALLEQIGRSRGFHAVARFHFHLRRLVERGIIVRSSHQDGHPLATVIPIAPAFCFPAAAVVSGHRYVMSRFAFVHTVGGQAVLESPLSHARVLLHDWRAAALIHAFAQPREPAPVDEMIPGLSPEAAISTLRLLIAAGMMLDADGGGPAAEDGGSLGSWEFHDLLFQTRSRDGRHDLPCGTTYAQAETMPPLPVVKSVTSGSFVDLPRPDMGRLEREDPPFARVSEERVSIREYAAEPMSREQLGEFLFRVARVRKRYAIDIEMPAGAMPLEATSRPYPSGGALYALEIYPVVQACRNVAAGLYHYDPLEHRLARLREMTPEVAGLVEHAAGCTGATAKEIQVLLVFSARFQRVSWKYSGLAYSLILKDVGVLQQSMYLAATAMGLAPCALGGGNSDLFARAAGTDYYAETSVGEFLLGSRRDDAVVP